MPSDLDSIISQLGAAPTKGPRRVDNRAEDVTKDQARRAAGGKAGKYTLKTINLSPDMIDQIERLARAEGIDLFAAYRWLLRVGLEAYGDGRRPEIAEVARRVKGDD